MLHSENITDLSQIKPHEQATVQELLEYYMGTDYFILKRTNTKVLLAKHQQEELLSLIEERNHFGILFFVNGLRK